MPSMAFLCLFLYRPSSSSKVIAKILHDTTVNAISTVGGWTKLEAGYVRTQYLVPETPTKINFKPSEITTAFPEYYVGTDAAFTRSGPGPAFNKVRTLALNTPIKIKDIVNSWASLSDSNEWIAVSYLSVYIYLYSLLLD